MADVKTLLVLSGGGSKGIWQWRVFRELQPHIQFDAVVGTSVGALNGFLVATGQHEKGDQLWTGMRQKHVYKKRKPIRLGFNFLLHKAGVRRAFLSAYDARPLQKLIKGFVIDRDWQFKMPLNTSRVDLRTGGVSYKTNQGKDVWRDMYASSAMPMIFQPLEYDGGLWVDGGVRDITPLGWGIKQYRETLERIVIITTEPTTHVLRQKSPRDLADVAEATITWMLDEIFQNDLVAFDRRNQLAREPGNKFFKEFKLDVLSPPGYLGSGLDLSKETQQSRLAGAAAFARQWVEENIK